MSHDVLDLREAVPAQRPAGGLWRWASLVPVLLMAGLLLTPVVVCVALHAREVVDDPDVWWHLRTADWMIQHRAVPRQDPFSTQAGRPWVAYTWLFDLVLDGFYRLAGLRGLLAFGCLSMLAITAAVLALIRRWQKSLLLSGIFTVMAVAGMLPLSSPRPWLPSVLFFTWELHLLLSAAEDRAPRRLFWLVPLFALWANLHIQFTLGLFVLGLAVVESMLGRFIPETLVDRASAALSWRWMLGIFGLCVAATLLNPYHARLYVVALQLLGQTELWDLVTELRAMSFRFSTHWIVLFTAIDAAVAWGAHRRMRLLLALLFPFALYLSFRSQRDQWVVVITSVTMLAYATRGLALPPYVLGPRQRLAVAGIVLLGCLATWPLLRESGLTDSVAHEYPVQALAHLQQAGYPGPMFNPYRWGGYLEYFYPRQPASMDGRTLVHGEARIVQHVRTLCAKKEWSDDADLARANLAVLESGSPLCNLLRRDPQFDVKYADDVATVLVRRGPGPAGAPTGRR